MGFICPAVLRYFLVSFDPKERRRNFGCDANARHRLYRITGFGEFVNCVPMKNRSLKVFKWALLLLVPMVVFMVMWPIARERRKVALTQELIDEARTLARLERIRDLVGQGADVNGKDRGRDAAMRGNTALHFLSNRGGNATHPQMIFLLSHGANVNAQNELGWTPLILASASGDVASIRLLLENGANANARTTAQHTVMDRSTRKKRTALGIAEATLQAEKTSPGSRMVPQLKETIKILKAAGAKE